MPRALLLFFYSERKDLMKKFLAGLTAFVLVFGMGATFGVVDKDVFSVCASAEEEKPTSGICGENVNWKLDKDGILTISGNGEMSASSGFAFNHDIKKVIIEDGVTRVSMSAFWRCEGIESITLPDSLKYIDTEAFAACTALKSIKIPATVEEIGNSAFFNCSGLKNVIISNGLKMICGSAFSGCSSLETLDIPESVTSIDEWAFYDCTNMTSITIPKSVTSIGEKALGYKFNHESQKIEKISGFVISGYKNSAAEKYAKDNGFKFVEIKNASITKGDPNGDNNINVTDIAVTASHIKGIKPLTDDQQKAADVNSDNEVNVTDIAMIAAHIKGIKAIG